MKNYNQLFIERFDKSTLIDDQFVKILNENGIKSGIEYLKSVGATKLDIDGYVIKYRISKWTQNDLTEEDKEQLLKELLDRKSFITSVDFKHNDYFNIPEVTIKTSNGIVSAMKLSAYKPKVKNYIPNIENESRFGHCYDYAYYLSLGIPFDNYLTTGYIYGYSDKSKFLHSWIETVINDKEYVIDATLNAIINKEGYYLLQHAKPINKINNKTFLDDLRKYPIIDNKNIPLEVYYVFRDEIIRELQKREKELER